MVDLPGMGLTTEPLKWGLGMALAIATRAAQAMEGRRRNAALKAPRPATRRPVA